MIDTWRAELGRCYTSVQDLAAAGLVTADAAAALAPVGATYRVQVTRYYAGLFDRRPAARCPIRLQALPAVSEADPPLPAWAQAWCARAYGAAVPWRADAIGDVARLAAARLTHRYAQRVIVHASPACAVYCRFCFRKAHLQVGERALYGGAAAEALAYVRAHPEVREVILTGGDPLSLPDARLGALLGALEGIAHVRHVRLHSRMAVTLPCRLTDALAAQLGGRRMLVSLVSHFNHPRECTAAALGRLEALRRRGVPLYNQTVLLRGVNDRAPTLGALWQRLYEAGVRPFYLHHPDYTPGTFAFRVSLRRGRRLMAALAGRLSGPALPQYVLDLPGGLGKVRLGPGGPRRLEARRDGALGGALYLLRPPHTRGAGAAATVLYPDLYPRQPRGA